jgi:hypothetical protein
VRILASTSVPFELTMVRMQNLASIETKRITVYRETLKSFGVIGLEGIVSQEEYFLNTYKIKTLLSRLNTYDF